jgi:hypothetical protein
MDDPKNPNEIIEETYEDLDMAEVVDFDKYEGMLYSEMMDDINDLTCEIVFDPDYIPEDDEDE